MTKRLLAAAAVSVLLTTVPVLAQTSLKGGLAVGHSNVKTSDSSGSMEYSGTGAGLYIGFDYQINPNMGVYIDCPFTFGNQFKYDASGYSTTNFDENSSYFDMNFAGGAYFALPVVKNLVSLYAGAGLSFTIQSCKYSSVNTLESLYCGQGIDFKGGARITHGHLLFDIGVSDSVNFLTLGRTEHLKINGDSSTTDWKNSTTSFGNFFTFFASAGYRF